MWDKYDEIWNVIKDILGIKFHSEPVYGYKYLTAKVREFDGAIKANFLGNVLKENMHYTRIACITIDSVMNFDEKIICKFIYKSLNIGRIKIQMFRFINTELKSDSESSDPDLDSEIMGAMVDKELMTKLKKSDSD